MEVTVSTEFIIVGAGGFGHELHDWVLAYQPNSIFRGFVDDDCGKKGVINSIDNFSNHTFEIYCGLGSSNSRKSVFDKFSDKFISFSCLISPLSQLSQSCQLGSGVVLLGNSSVAANTKIGNGCLIQGFSVVGHDVVCGDFVSIYSFVFVGGGVVVGAGASIFPHAVILPGIKIGANSIVGAGSVVVSDVPENVTVFGNPAKIIKRN
jgi:sugar O-acyltransferase (sialic acid O-acetyltransferase NeuD family)